MAGGGTALIRAAQRVNEAGLPEMGDDEAHGFRLLLKACNEPFLRIVHNATGSSGSVLLNKILENKTEGYGLDASDMEMKNLLEAGILDPVLVVRNALANAASVASVMLTTECLIRKPGPAKPGDMRMSGMGFPGM